MLNEILKLANTAVAVFVAAGGGFGLSKFLNFKASTEKNENIKKALEFASQAVLTAQAFLGNGAVQQQAAAAELKARLDENKIGDNFTEAQILSYIKTAYAHEKANGALGAVKPLVSAEELAKAEAVVSNAPETAQAPTA
ncbi:hypothetical protein [Leuconostoc holzapfelii]|uniref:Holin n=1 Tax=Leuconostoc holzapfelii TaxID=434464 RepID=A0A846ZFC3_9LACO|nr:hypothetical protein [Leuconostoc holzapfelii]NKZ18854.1 hypothetical protein [Leuconostoc holzapfelii]